MCVARGVTAKTQRPTRYDMHAFQIYDAFPIAIKEIMSHANYNNHNIITSVFVAFGIHFAFGSDSDSPAFGKKRLKITPINYYVRSREAVDREFLQSVRTENP